MKVLTNILTRLLGGWRWVLGAAAGIAVLFYRWRANHNARKAAKAEDKLRYMEAKESRDVRLEKEMEVRQEIHKKERENLRKRRREGKRGGGLGKW